jgi:hypothetical protein
VAQACEEFVKAEMTFLDYFKSQDITTKGFVEAEAQCRNSIEQLRIRVAKK